MTAPHPGPTSWLVDLAADHGLTIHAGSIHFNDAGLDFQVAFATAEDDTRWVLRIPRRGDVSDAVADEERTLRLARDRLSVSVPNWRIWTRDLIAYPALPGTPGLTLDDAGDPVWHFDREGPHYARSLGRLIAELHGIEADDAQASGIPTESPAEVRDQWGRRLERVSAEFTIAPELLEQWNSWLADDHLWPEFTTFTHGELYPAHLLLAPDGGVLSVIDWTTAKVSDPALDFMFHYMLSTPATFQVAVDAYAQTGAPVPNRLPERCAALIAAGPLNYAAYALTTGDPEHADVAAAQLNPHGIERPPSTAESTMKDA